MSVAKVAASQCRTGHADVARDVTADDVSAWLLRAGAVPPFADPDECAAAAETVNAYRRAKIAWQKMQADDADTMKAFTRAHDAVQALRSALPVVMLRYAQCAAQPSLLGGEGVADDMAVKLAELGKMFTALADVPKAPAALPFLDGWHTLAVCMFRAAGAITGTAPTLTPNGLAVQFARAGIEAAGHGQIEPGTIAQAIRRHVTYKSTGAPL